MLRGVPGRYPLLVTKKAVVYREVQTIRHTNLEVVFSHTQGLAVVPWEELPDEMLLDHKVDAFARHDPLLAAKKQAEFQQREAARKKKILESKGRVKLLIQVVKPEGCLARCWPVVQVPTKKKNFSGEYFTEDSISKQSMEVWLPGFKGFDGQEVGVVEMYQAGTELKLASGKLRLVSTAVAALELLRRDEEQAEGRDVQ